MFATLLDGKLGRRGHSSLGCPPESCLASISLLHTNIFSLNVFSTFQSLVYLFSVLLFMSSVFSINVVLLVILYLYGNFRWKNDIKLLLHNRCILPFQKNCSKEDLYCCMISLQITYCLWSILSNKKLWTECRVLKMRE